MKVLSPSGIPDGPGEVDDIPEWSLPAGPLDLTRCTRCGQPWGYRLVEKVEIWRCIDCGYEARERSSDYRRVLMARREAMVS